MFVLLPKLDKTIKTTAINHLKLFYYVDQLSFICKVYNFFEPCTSQKFYEIFNLLEIKISTDNWGINKNKKLNDETVML